MPAGNIEKLKYAVKYGADAVYLGVVDFSLRAMRKGELITLENLKFAIDTARKMGAKAYLTLNIFGFNSDIKNLEAAMDRIVDSNPDALIISDVGIMRLAQKYMPNTDIHVSTQANILNYALLAGYGCYKSNSRQRTSNQRCCGNKTKSSGNGIGMFYPWRSMRFILRKMSFE